MSSLDLGSDLLICIAVVITLYVVGCWLERTGWVPALLGLVLIVSVVVSVWHALAG